MRVTACNVTIEKVEGGRQQLVSCESHIFHHHHHTYIVTRMSRMQLSPATSSQQRLSPTPRAHPPLVLPVVV